MLIAAILLVVTPLDGPLLLDSFISQEAALTKKWRKTAASGAGRKLGGCAEARRAGYTHMRRRQAGYSTSLDRDGDGVACDKMKSSAHNRVLEQT